MNRIAISKYRDRIGRWIPLGLLVLHVGAQHTKVALRRLTKHTMRIFGFGTRALTKLDGTQCSKWQ